MKNQIDGLFKEAISEYIEGNYSKSIGHLQDILQADPEHRLASLTLGSAWLRSGEAQKALDQFDALIQSDPGHARAYHLRGFAHQNLGDSEAALKDFSTAIEIDADYGAAYHSRATLLGELGETDKAAEDIEVIAHLTQRNLESFSNENNVWRSQQMYVESEMGSEFDHLVGSA